MVVRFCVIYESATWSTCILHQWCIDTRIESYQITNLRIATVRASGLHAHGQIASCFKLLLTFE